MTVGIATVGIMYAYRDDGREMNSHDLSIYYYYYTVGKPWRILRKTTTTTLPNSDFDPISRIVTLTENMKTKQ